MAIVDVRFVIHYRTVYGQAVGILGSHPLLGAWDKNKPLLMTYTSDGNWEKSIELPQNFGSIEYKYVLIDTQSTLPIRWEAEKNKVLKQLPAHYSKVEVRDYWQEAVVGNEVVFRTAAFKDVIFRRTSKQDAFTWPAVEKGKLAVLFEVEQVRVTSDHQVHISGSGPTFGEWQPKRSLQLSDNGFPKWTIAVNITRADVPLRYKYATVKDETYQYEHGQDRGFMPAPLDDRDLIIVRDKPFFVDRGAESLRTAGVAVPVFSLRSRNSFGVGEFLDIKPLVDWANQAGLRIIQVLPVNDTCVHNTWWDTYPYSSLSVFALHPMYINLEALNPSKEILNEIKELRPHLNDGFLKYEEMISAKKRLIHKIFEAKKKEFLASDEFKKFFEDNENWLRSYALFCFLRDKFKTSDYNTWPKYNNITEAEVKQLTDSKNENYEALAETYFIQFHLDKQLREAANYAKEHRVVLKGDLPIGVDPLSVDTWVYRHLFRTKVQVGAPPDAFSTDGQNWGFPAYDWEEMAKDDYAWWRQRLRVLAKYFQAYRIDHILGFFRIWEISKDRVGGLIGRFNPSIPVWHWELENNGLWDFDRLTKPYVRYYHFEKHFPGEEKQIIAKYFDENNGAYSFKPEYSTEKKIEKSLELPADAPQDLKDKNAKTMQSLFILIRNVVFIRDDEDPYRFYPRINVFQTDSYHSLPDHEKSIIYNLYISYFYERQDEEWRWKAMQKLPVMIRTTDMLVCAEDLGMIPACVQGVLDELSMLGLRIQRMPKDPKIEIDHPSTYPYMTVCTPSVHDTSTLRGWWEEDREVTQRFWNNILGEPGHHPWFCEPWVVEKILRQHFHSPSMFAIICIQDFFALSNSLRLENPEDERINIPAKNRFHYWKYRIQLPIEELIEQHPYLANQIQEDLRYSDRLL